MNPLKNFVVDDKGKIQSVISDHQSYQKKEELLLDHGLSKAMEEVEDDVEFI
ncbi:MAG: antitoxin [Candidatus Cloacimonetes bacterium]|nr:antitoxin [Candidatus Cloacimonadota bacterium]